MADKSGFVNILIPKSGLFIRRGALVAGDGVTFAPAQSVRIYPSKASAVKGKKERMKAICEQFPDTLAKTIPVTYREV
jgi:hypothetical protein